MNVKSYNGRDIQMFLSLLNQAESEGVTDIRFIRQRLQNQLAAIALTAKKIAGNRSEHAQPVKPQSPDNITTCSECGKSAIIVPINTGNGNQIDDIYTHAVQCQNRPGSGTPWQPGHCGHTEYIILGEK